MTIITLLRTVTPKSSVVNVSVRSLSESTSKLKKIFDEYQHENYSRETERCFQSEIIGALMNKGGNQAPMQSIHIDNVRKFLVNIGASDRMGEEELTAAMNEIAENNDQVLETVPADKVRSFLQSSNEA